jgi:two-component system LytT family response regulator
MEKIIIKTGKNFYLVDKSDIDFVESDKNYSRISCGPKYYIVKKSLNLLEDKLGSEKFIRVNRSTIVNIDRIKVMKELNDNRYIIVLNNEKTFSWGRGYKNNLVKLIKI